MKNKKKMIIDKKKFGKRLLWFMIIIVIGHLILSIIKGLWTLHVLKKEYREKSKAYQEAIKEEVKQDKELNSLSKRESIEKIARDELNMKASGEVIYKLVTSKEIAEHSGDSVVESGGDE